VEQRPPGEVIEGDVPFKVRNPAFERVPIEMFTGIISEIGILDPHQVDGAMQNYDYLIPELKKLVNWDRWDV
jgi:translation initiation factor 2B subunit (eIF-2B alpha/beta/delta family)